MSKKKKRNKNLNNYTPKTNDKLNELVNETVEQIKNDKKLDKLVSDTFDELKKENNNKKNDPVDKLIEDNGWNIDVLGNKLASEEKPLHLESDNRFSDQEIDFFLNNVENKKVKYDEINQEQVSSEREKTNELVDEIDKELNHVSLPDDEYITDNINDSKKQDNTQYHDYYESVNNKVRRLDSILKNEINHDDAINEVSKDENLVDKLYETNINYDAMTEDPSDLTQKIDVIKDNLDDTRAINKLKPIDIDVAESDEMKVDDSITHAIFKSPITDEDVKEYQEQTINKEIIKDNKLDDNKHFKISNILWMLLGLVILFFILLNIFSSETVFNKFITNLSNGLGIKSSEELDYNLRITSSGDSHYTVLNNMNITGLYESNDNDFYNTMNISTSLEDDFELNYLTKDDYGYLVDFELTDRYLKFNKKYDFSVNKFKKNLISLLKQINSSDINSYINNKVNGLDNELSLDITETNISTIVSSLQSIKLDNLYQDLLNKLITDMSDNSSNYIGVNIKLDIDLLGNLKKLEISGKEKITISKTDSTYTMEYIAEDNSIINIKICKENINITRNVGSRVDYAINLDMTFTKSKGINKLVVNDDNVIDMNSINMDDEFNIKKNISLSKCHSNLLGLYYYLNGGLNSVDMYVSDGINYVYYSVPNEYNISNYNGLATKKYINVDRTIVYSLVNYTDYQVNDYVSSEYQKDIESFFYYDVSKSETKELSYNNYNYKYQIITKTYDSNYENYDTTSSTLYIWNRVSDNVAFMIEYEFQGNSISEEDITKLLNIQVG